jgi:hypothetical protein
MYNFLIHNEVLKTSDGVDIQTYDPQKVIKFRKYGDKHFFLLS